MEAKWLNFKICIENLCEGHILYHEQSIKTKNEKQNKDVGFVMNITKD
jgi:hypothetical protein